MKLEAYWLDSAPAFSGAEQPIEGRADVVIVGGGFTGLSAPLAFARKGARAVGMEAGRIEGEGSGPNGRHCNHGLAHDYATLADGTGADKAGAFYRAYDAAVDTVERIVADEQIACDFVRRGKLKLAAKPAHYEKL